MDLGMISEEIERVGVQLEDRYSMLIMDPKLAVAAKSGDVSYLKTMIAAIYEDNKQDYSPLLAHHNYYCTKRGKRIGGNILHVAAWEHNAHFIEEAIKILLPSNIIDTLVSQQIRADENSVDIEFEGWNPLHVAAAEDVQLIGVIRVFLEFYKSNNNNPDATPTHGKPWVAQTSVNHLTPLHLALLKGYDECGELILEMDMELFSNMVDNSGRSVLYLAIENNCPFVAFKILSSLFTCNLEGPGGKTPLHVLSRCDDPRARGEADKVCKQLLKLHPELIKAIDNIGQTALHSWCETGSIWPLEYGLECEEISVEAQRDLFELLTTSDSFGNIVFHIVAASGMSPSFHKIGAKLVEVYIELRKKLKMTSMHCDPPWLTTKNNLGLTTVDLALGIDPKNKDEREQEAQAVFCCVLQGDYAQLFGLVSKDSDELAGRVLDATTRFGCFYNPARSKSLLLEALEYSEKVGIWIFKNYRDTQGMSANDTQIKALLKKALENEFAEMITAILDGHPHALKQAHKAWVKACKKGRLSTIYAITDNFPGFSEFCEDMYDSPLHHIQLPSCKDYQNFLEHSTIISEFKNFLNPMGEAPLHVAIRNNNIGLAEALLTTHGVDKTIEDKMHSTPLDLLAEKFYRSQNWKQMCKRCGITKAMLRAAYFKDKAKLLEAQSTLSVVATILATITFTVGFTLPGGVNTTGKPVLASKAAFIVFLVADTFAMCCSMLVLLCLVWSRISESSRSLFLVEWSMKILAMAFASTILAFMTGVYVVMPSELWWVAIIILVTCSAFIIFSQRKVIDKIIDKFYPTSNDRIAYFRLRSVEEGNVDTSNISDTE